MKQKHNNIVIITLVVLLILVSGSFSYYAYQGESEESTKEEDQMIEEPLVVEVEDEEEFEEEEQLIEETYVFEYEPYDKPVGTSGEKAILYIGIQDSVNDVTDQTYVYLLNLVDQGFITLSLRNLNGFDLGFDSTELKNGLGALTIDSYTNCVKLVSPENYFDYIYSMEDRAIVSFSPKTFNELQYFLESHLPAGVNLQEVKQCIESDSYEQVIFEENEVLEEIGISSISGTPDLVFPELKEQLPGWIKDEDNMVEYVGTILDLSEYQYVEEKIDPKERLKELL